MFKLFLFFKFSKTPTYFLEKFKREGKKINKRQFSYAIFLFFCDKHYCKCIRNRNFKDSCLSREKMF